MITSNEEMTLPRLSHGIEWGILRESKFSVPIPISDESNSHIPDLDGNWTLRDYPFVLSVLAVNVSAKSYFHLSTPYCPHTSSRLIKASSFVLKFPQDLLPNLQINHVRWCLCHLGM